MATRFYQWIEPSLAWGSQIQFAEAWMIGRPRTLGPEKFAFLLGNRHVVDAGFSTTHEAMFVEFPIFIAIGTIPIIGLIVPLILKTHSDAVVVPSPQLFD